jgi:hypothetical protein
MISRDHIMNSRLSTLTKSLACLAALALCATLFRNASPAKEGADDVTVLAANGAERWYRGNMHTHTHWSDGDHYLEMVALWYKEHAYDFLVVTDHNTLDQSEKWIDVEKSKGGLAAYEKLKAQFPQDWIVERQRDERQEIRLKTYHDVAARLNEYGKFLLLPGEEISDRFGKRPIHLNATNLKEALPPLGGESVYEAMQKNVDAVIAQRERTGQPMLIHLNHPNFHYGITAEDLMRVRGENFFEVYNGHPGVNNAGDEFHASTERIWDIVNAFRQTELDLPLMYGLATDDGHNYHKIPSRASEPGRGWVMVLTDSLTPEALITALEAGRFYATNGVVLEKIISGKDRLSVEVKPEAGAQFTIEFLGTSRDFDRSSEPVLDQKGQPLEATRRYSDQIGRVLKTVQGLKAEYVFTGDELSVRARVTSSKLHPNPSMPGDKEQAWIQPVVGPGAAR